MSEQKKRPGSGESKTPADGRTIPRGTDEHSSGSEKGGDDRTRSSPQSDAPPGDGADRP